MSCPIYQRPPEQPWLRDCQYPVRPAPPCQSRLCQGIPLFQPFRERRSPPPPQPFGQLHLSSFLPHQSVVLTPFPKVWAVVRVAQEGDCTGPGQKVGSVVADLVDEVFAWRLWVAWGDLSGL